MEVEIDFQIRPFFREFVESDKRFSVVAAHRRAGKSVATVQKLLKAVFTDKPHSNGTVRRYYVISPTFAQSKSICWEYLKDWLHEYPGIQFKNGTLEVIIPEEDGPGSVISLHSGDAAERLRGSYADFVLLDESAQLPQTAWDNVIRPMLADYSGRAAFLGTPRGRDFFHDILVKAEKDPEWFAMRLPVTETNCLTDEEVEELRNQLGERAFAQEMLVDFSVSTPGAIFADLMETAIAEGRVSDEVMHRRNLPVYVSFDVGAPINTRATFFQVSADRISIIEQKTGGTGLRGPADWASYMDSKEWMMGQIILPHDSAADVGGHWDTGFAEAGYKICTVLPRCFNVWDLINQACEAFPRVTFAENGTLDLVKSLLSWECHEEKDGITIRKVPNHDHHSHNCSSFYYAMQAIEEGYIQTHINRQAAPVHIQPALKRGLSRERAKMY